MDPSPTSAHDLDLLADEHRALLRHYGQVQLRCGDLVRAQAAEIDELKAQVMRLRAAVIARDTALSWTREHSTSLRTSIPEKTSTPAEDIERLEVSLVAADLVICQTGCLSHGAYWRVQDLCRRTGKTCVLVEEPDAVRIVRIHKPPQGEPQEAR